MDNFTKVLVTEQFIFYHDLSEFDENANTKMFDSNMKLVSENYFAYQGLLDELIDIKNDRTKPIYMHEYLAENLSELVE